MTGNRSRDRSGKRRHMELEPAHWWQAVSFIRLNFQIMKGHDPWADRVLAQPWSLSSIIEYLYLLATFPRSDTHFITIAGERAGVLWTMKQDRLLYVLSLGLLSRFQSRGIGLRAACLIRDYGNDHEFRAIAARIATSNRPIQRVVKAFGSQIPGLATTRLTLKDVIPPALPLPGVTITASEIGKGEAGSTWKRWKLQAVRHVSGQVNADIAAGFMDAFDWLDAPPKATYLTLRSGDEDVGFCFVRRRQDGVDLGLLTDPSAWSGPQTASLVAAMAAHLGSPIHYLTLLQRHADALATSAPFAFGRDPGRERHFVFWQYPYSLSIGSDSRKRDNP